MSNDRCKYYGKHCNHLKTTTQLTFQPSDCGGALNPEVVQSTAHSSGKYPASNVLILGEEDVSVNGKFNYWVTEYQNKLGQGFTLKPELQKSKKLAPTNFLTQKISTKTSRFTTFPNSRQNSVNAFEIKHFYAQCLFLTQQCCHNRCYYHRCY